MHVNEQAEAIGDNLHITRNGYCSFAAGPASFSSLKFPFPKVNRANRSEILYALEQQVALPHGRARVRACATTKPPAAAPPSLVSLPSTPPAAARSDAAFSSAAATATWPTWWWWLPFRLPPTQSCWFLRMSVVSSDQLSNTMERMN